MERNTKKQIKTWGLIVAGLALFVLIIVGLSMAGGGGQTTLSDKEWIKGNENASISLVEYSDFQCPACSHYYPFVKQLAEEMGEQVKIVYRHFPLNSIHPNAQEAAQAAEAAGLQGNFWEMHDRLFEGQSSWSSLKNPQEKFSNYAQELGLDLNRFNQDFDSSAVKDAIREDISSGNAARVNGTPSFFLNGNKINNPSSYDELRQLVQNELSS